MIGDGVLVERFVDLIGDIFGLGSLRSSWLGGVGGFLGVDKKDVAVPFSAVKWTTKDKKNYLTLNTTKDELKSAQGLKYDSDKTARVSDKAK